VLLLWIDITEKIDSSPAREPSWSNQKERRVAIKKYIENFNF